MIRTGSQLRESTQEVAKGRWREILIALGISERMLDGKHHPCPLPGCGGRDRFRYTDKDGVGKYICGQCGAGNGFELLKRLHGWTYPEAAQEIDKIIGNLPPPKPKREQVHWVDVAYLWRTCRPIVTADPASSYLRGRGIDLAVWPKSLRYVAKWKHAPSGKFLPCMMALFRSPDGKLGTVHRTYLADVKPRRMFLPGGIPRGGAVRLWAPDVCLGVAEGIETALSAALLFKMPVWACCNEGLLRQWQPPECCTHVTIFGDNDSSFVGQRAAYELAWRLARDGLKVKVEIPPSPDWDWNDAIRNEIETERYPGLQELRLHGRAGEFAGQSISHA